VGGASGAPIGSARWGATAGRWGPRGPPVCMAARGRRGAPSAGGPPRRPPQPGAGLAGLGAAPARGGRGQRSPHSTGAAYHTSAPWPGRAATRDENGCAARCRCDRRAGLLEGGLSLAPRARIQACPGWPQAPPTVAPPRRAHAEQARVQPPASPCPPLPPWQLARIGYGLRPERRRSILHRSQAMVAGRRNATGMGSGASMGERI
jgi:hypothetical protein